MTPYEDLCQVFFGEIMDDHTRFKMTEYLNTKYPVATWRVEFDNSNVIIAPKFDSPEKQLYYIIKWG